MARSQAVRKSQQVSVAERHELLRVLHWAGLATPAAWLLFVLLALVLISGLLVVRTTHQNRFAFNELQELKDEAVALNVAWGQLLIEQSTFGLEGRIEEKAAAQLDMRVPDIADIVMVEND